MTELEDLAGTTTPDGRYQFDSPLGSGAFGVVFRGHPKLRRILLAEDFEGYPLRKDYVDPRRRKVEGQA